MTELGGYGVSGGLGARQRSEWPRRWMPTPKWHWRYWIGHRMRKQADELYDPPDYRTFGQHARAVLEEQALGPGPAKQQDTEEQATAKPRFHGKGSRFNRTI